MTLGWTATLPYRGVARLRRHRAERWPRLPRPTISVGNLAFGGRGKTPAAAAIARAALDAGLRPAILSRGYGGRIGGRDAAVVLRGQSGPPWLQPVVSSADLAGEEPAWLAASCPGIAVGVHRNRLRAAAAVLAEQPVDLFVLDDGFQTPLRREIDLVLLDAAEDPPFRHRPGSLREGQGALRRASLLGVFGASAQDLAASTLPPCPALGVQRGFGGLRRLRDGAPVAPETAAEVVVAAGVGNPASVDRLLTDAGVAVGHSLKLRDHRRPSRGQLARGLSSGRTLVVTEKDAVGWAHRLAPGDTLVLSMEIQGMDAVADRALQLLGSKGGMAGRAVAFPEESG